MRGQAGASASVDPSPLTPDPSPLSLWGIGGSRMREAGVDLQQVPLTTMLDVCRHMGATLPENLSAQGSVSGSVTYNEPQGMQGRFDAYPIRRGFTRVKGLLGAGVNVAIGHDSIMDPWYPLGVGDPLQAFDPIMLAVPDQKARNRMVSSLDQDNAVPNWALCYRFDIVLRGRNQTPTER